MAEIAVEQHLAADQVGAGVRPQRFLAARDRGQREP